MTFLEYPSDTHTEYHVQYTQFFRRHRRRHHLSLSERILRFLGLYHLFLPKPRFIDARTGHSVDRRGRRIYKV